MKIKFKFFELTCWIASLLLLALMEPGTESHYSFCILKLLGIGFCNGCGLGHSISHLFHGDINASFSSHPLGIFAVLVIVIRIYRLLHYHFYQTIFPKK